MINPVKHRRAVLDTRLDPEVQAGRALRRLRLSRGWSQEEVAVRMRAYDHDFHQTTIAKIEAAQRPLRVRELADFALLYGVEINALIYPPKASLEEIDQEITVVEERRREVQRDVDVTASQLLQARAELDHVQAAHDACSLQFAMMEERLDLLRKQREKLTLWSTSEEESATSASDEESPDFSEDLHRELKPDPVNATTPSEFLETLWQYREWSGSPSWRAMADRTGNAVVFSTMYNAMNSDALPKLHVVRAIIIGCGGSEDDLRDFVNAWRRIAVNRARRSEMGSMPESGIQTS